ncbi:MAG: protein kinase [Acidobacteriota bacterium]|nr:protein kinase [Acidobacteriota bacterium]
MQRERWLKVKELVAAAQVIPEAERAAWLDEACGDDTAVFSEVSALLEEGEEATSLHTESFATGDTIPYGANLAGMLLGAWRLIRPLGTGGMGAVWLAERADAVFRMPAAVKLLSRGDTELMIRFQRERQFLADLKHPNICIIYDGGATPGGLPYLVMEYVDGNTINQWCQDRQLSTRQILQLFHQVCLAVAYAHRKGILHRDIKPGNIMVNADGLAKLMDFGIAGDESSDDFEGFAPMTPEYAAPERLRGEPVTAAADIYGLGLLLFNLLTEMRPKLADGAYVPMLRRLAANRDDPLMANLSELLETILARDPEDRPASVDEIVSMVDYLLSQGSAEDDFLYDAVYWYHPEARDQVEDIARHLEDEAGLKQWLDIWHQVPGEDEIAALTSACIKSSCLVVPVAGKGPWLSGAQRMALKHAISDHTFRVVPVLLSGGKRPERESDLPAFLRGRVWTIIRDVEDKEALNRLLAAVRGRNRTRLPAGMQGVCPFRGLDAFGEDDRDLFFGRDATVQSLELHLRENHFLAVLGPSGSGKSSVVRAGLLPILRDENRLPALMTPGAKPLEELGVVLSNLFRDAGEITYSEDVLERLKRNDNSLFLLLGDLRMAGHAESVCLIIDQFEEIFTQAGESGEVGLFLTCLFYALEHPESKLDVIITMRSDFLGKCTSWPELNSYLLGNIIQVGPMTAQGLREAVERPVQLVGASVENELVEDILRDMANEPGALPLMQYALSQIWEECNGQVLTHESYLAVGGLSGALERRADQVFDELSEEEQQFCKTIFLRLIQPGEGTEDTRRRVRLKELRSGSDSRGLMEVVLGELADAHLIVTEGDLDSEEGFAQIAHEALIRSWPRLRGWIEADRDAIRLHRRLAMAAHEWGTHKKDPSFLLRGARLIECEDWAQSHRQSLNEEEASFLAASLKLRRTEEEKEARYQQTLRRRFRWAVGGGLVAALSAILAVGLFYDAQRAREDADIQRKEAGEFAQFLLNDLYNKLSRRNMVGLMNGIVERIQGYLQSLDLEDATKDEMEIRQQTFTNIAEILKKSGRINDALPVFKQLLETAEASAALEPDNWELQYQLGLLYFHVGDAYEMLGRFEEVPKYWGSYLEIMKRGAEQTKGEKWVMEVGWAMGSMAISSANREDYTQWGYYARRSGEVFQDLVDQKPGSFYLRSGLSLAYKLIGQRELLRNPRPALDRFIRARDILIGVDQKDPGDYLARQYLATAHLHSGMTMHLLGMTEEGMSELAKSGDQYASILKDQKNIHGVRPGYLRQLILMCYLQREQGLNGEAEKTLALIHEQKRLLAGNQIESLPITYDLAEWDLLLAESYFLSKLDQDAVVKILDDVGELAAREPGIENRRKILARRVAVLRGRLYLASGKPDLAEQSFEAALPAEPLGEDLDFQVMIDYVWAYIGTGRQKPARDLLLRLEGMGFKNHRLDTLRKMLPAPPR